MIRTGGTGVDQTMTRRLFVLICVLGLIASGCSRGESDPPSSRRSPGATTAPDAAGDEGAEGDPTKPGSGANPARATARPGASAGEPEGPRPYSDVPENQRITWEEALEWWPYRPLLRHAQAPKPEFANGRESLFATSKDGGTKGDPRKQFCTLTAFWEVPPYTSDVSDYLSIVANGGMAVTVRFYPPSLPFEKGAQGGKPIVVRGTNAWMYELRSDKATADEHEWRFHGSADIRYVQWQEYLPRDGGTIDWLVLTHAVTYSEQDTYAAINAMTEVR
jgi:hypothetical protein